MKFGFRSTSQRMPGRWFPASPICFTRFVLGGALLAGSALLFTGAPLLAQNTTADVLGTVTDESGAVIPNAKVELTNLETHETRTLTSGDSGEYVFTLLKPSRYSLSVTAAGFKVFRIESFSISAGDRAREDSHMVVGSQGEIVNVDALPPELHTDTSSLITTVTERRRRSSR